MQVTLLEQTTSERPEGQMNTVSVYALIDPREPEKIRYVGVAKDARTRHFQHCTDGGITHKAQWINTLRESGVMPQMVILEVVEELRGLEAERIWINRFRPELMLNDAIVKQLAIATSAPVKAVGKASQRYH